MSRLWLTDWLTHTHGKVGQYSVWAEFAIFQIKLNERKGWARKRLTWAVPTAPAITRGKTGSPGRSTLQITLCDFETSFSIDICLYKFWFITSLNSFLKARQGSNRGVVGVVPAVRPGLVLYLSKKLEWPAVVGERNAEKVTIEILNKDRTNKVVHPTQVKPFVMANVSSKRYELLRAYKEVSKM